MITQALILKVVLTCEINRMFKSYEIILLYKRLSFYRRYPAVKKPWKKPWLCDAKSHLLKLQNIMEGFGRATDYRCWEKTL